MSRILAVIERPLWYLWCGSPQQYIIGAKIGAVVGVVGNATNRTLIYEVRDLQKAMSRPVRR